MAERTPPEVKEAESSKDESSDVKCDNHPQRQARTFTGNGAYEVHLCEECTPSWFTD